MDEHVDDADWFEELRSGGSRREPAVARLHALLLRGARAEAARRGPRNGIVGAELEDLAHEAADDALLAVLRKLDAFRGESRFSTWAYKFVVLEVSRKTHRHVWHRSPPRDPHGGWATLPDRFGLGPGEALAWRELFAALRRSVETDLTDHQRAVFEAIVLRAVPLDELVAELGSTRGAVYKTLYDARRKLRDRLVAGGHLPVDGSVSVG